LKYHAVPQRQQVQKSLKGLVYNLLAIAELRAAANMRGGFILASNSFDALSAFGRIFAEVQLAAGIVRRVDAGTAQLGDFLGVRGGVDCHDGVGVELDREWSEVKALQRPLAEGLLQIVARGKRSDGEAA
jgi:hypothetical protein